MKRGLVILLLVFGSHSNAWALPGQKSKARVLATTAGYGAAAGAATGLLTWPVTGSSKGVLWGAGVGAVLGTAAGVYHLNNKDDPENPLHSDAEKPSRDVLGDQPDFTGHTEFLEQGAQQLFEMGIARF